MDLLDREASPGHFASADILHATEQLNQWVVDNKVAHKGTAGIVIGAVCLLFARMCLHVCSLMLHRECRPCCHCVVAVAELLPRLRRRPASPHRAALYGRLDSSKGPHGRRVHQDTAVPSQYVTYSRLLPCGHLTVCVCVCGWIYGRQHHGGGHARKVVSGVQTARWTLPGATERVWLVCLQGTSQTSVVQL